MQDFGGPILRLSGLSAEEFYLLLEKIRFVYAYGNEEKAILPVEGIEAFMQHAAKRLGAAYFSTPSNVITSFIDLLSVLEQNKKAKWEKLLGALEIQKDSNAETALLAEDDEEMAVY
jgi:hypothetical protein